MVLLITCSTAILTKPLNPRIMNNTAVAALRLERKPGKSALVAVEYEKLERKYRIYIFNPESYECVGFDSSDSRAELLIEALALSQQIDDQYHTAWQ